MGVSRYNSEGYPDPTTYGALSKIENEMKAARAYRPIVYVCSPFSGNVEKNTANARDELPQVVQTVQKQPNW